MESFISSFLLVNTPPLLPFYPLERVHYFLVVLFLYGDISGKTYSPLLLDVATDFCDCILTTLCNFEGLTFCLCFIIVAQPFTNNEILSLFRVQLISMFVPVFQCLAFFVHCIFFNTFCVYWYQTLNG